MYVARHPVHIEGRPVKVITSTGEFLGYGYWELFPQGADWAHKAAERGWIELQLWAKEPWQVERWDTQGGSISRPKPPVPAMSRHRQSRPCPPRRKRSGRSPP